VSKPVVIRDAVWGDVELDPLLNEVLGTREIQRLRGIRQLGTAHLVYPSANHTRFEHVLGTCHVAGRILDALERGGHTVDDDQRRLIRVAALSHDVGHVPFGHTFEDERRLFPRHDGPARTNHFLGPRTELGQLLDREGLTEGVRTALGADRDATGSLAYDVVSGTVCADLLDYLARDAHCTGIRRSYDERLFRYFALKEGRLVLQLSKRGLPREDAFSEVVHLLRLRYTLSERVYFHHAKVCSGALVSKLVERAVGLGLELPELYPLGDEGLLLHLEARYAPRDEVLARLLDDFRSRRLPKRAYVLTRRISTELQDDLVRRFHDDRAERERFEAELEAELGLQSGDVIVYCPAPGMSLKEANVLVDAGPGGVQELESLGLAEVRELQEKHRQLWKFFVLVSGRRAELRGRLAELCAARLGAENELDRGLSASTTR
jgi:HD superfamily phosphohydrolase